MVVADRLRRIVVQVLLPVCVVQVAIAIWGFQAGGLVAATVPAMFAVTNTLIVIGAVVTGPYPFSWYLRKAP